MEYVIIWIVCAVAGYMIGKGKGKAGVGAALGLFLGPLGVIIILVMSSDAKKVEETSIATGEYRKCPFCAELVKSEAVVCKHCGKDLPAFVKVESIAPGSWKCSKCGALNRPDDDLCDKCVKPRFE